MKPKLRASFSTDGDGTGELFVEVAAPPFTGAGAAWFSTSELIDFGEALAETYPLSAESPLVLRGGYWDNEGKSVIQVHVGLEFVPFGARGSVGCRVELAAPVHVDDRGATHRRVDLKLICAYEDMRSFGMALKAIAVGTEQEAELACDEG